MELVECIDTGCHQVCGANYQVVVWLHHRSSRRCSYWRSRRQVLRKSALDRRFPCRWAKQNEANRVGMTTRNPSPNCRSEQSSHGKVYSRRPSLTCYLRGDVSETHTRPISIWRCVTSAPASTKPPLRF